MRTTAAGIAALAILGLAVGLSPPAHASGPHSTVAPIDLPDGTTALSGGTWPADTIKGERWHYTGS
jgi:hypothetical protein